MKLLAPRLVLLLKWKNPNYINILSRTASAEHVFETQRESDGGTKWVSRVLLLPGEKSERVHHTHTHSIQAERERAESLFIAMAWELYWFCDFFSLLLRPFDAQFLHTHSSQSPPCYFQNARSPCCSTPLPFMNLPHKCAKIMQGHQRTENQHFVAFITFFAEFHI